MTGGFFPRRRAGSGRQGPAGTGRGRQGHAWGQAGDRMGHTWGHTGVKQGTGKGTQGRAWAGMDRQGRQAPGCGGVSSAHKLEKSAPVHASAARWLSRHLDVALGGGPVRGHVALCVCLGHVGALGHQQPALRNSRCRTLPDGDKTEND